VRSCHFYTDNKETFIFAAVKTKKLFKDIFDTSPT